VSHALAGGTNNGNRTPVLVLNLFNHTGVGIARSLGRLGVPVYAVHETPRAPAAASRYFKRTFAWDLSHEPPDASIARLLEIGRSIGSTPILIPTEDLSCLFVADNAESLRAGFLFPDQPSGLARALSNKQQMFHLCREHGVPTPDSVFPTSREDVLAFAEHVTFPVMLKTIETRPFEEDDPLKAGGGKLIAADRSDLLECYDKLELSGDPNVLLQEFIPGGAESVWMLNGYFDAESDGAIVFTGRKLRQYPPYTGQTSLGLCTWNERVAETTREFMKRLGYRGILDIGYRYDRRDDQYKLLDVNPRIGAAFRLFLGTGGMDVVRALYFDLTGRSVPAERPREDRRWLVENYDVASSIKYCVDGVLTPRRWLGSFKGVEEAAWFARDDLRPFAAMCAHSMRYAAGNLVGVTDRRPEWWRRGRPQGG